MTYEAIVSREAAADMAAARDWYAENAPEQVVRLIHEVDAAIARICEFPEACPRVQGEARRTKVKVFPYQLWFRLLAAHRTVEVVALVHVRQNRARFTDRLG